MADELRTVLGAADTFESVIVCLLYRRRRSLRRYVGGFTEFIVDNGLTVKSLRQEPL